jgi:polysaccharide pyruvyl transferase WcaK-like protein
MPRICLLDPSITSRDGAAPNNLGDSIIRESVVLELTDLLPGWDWSFVPTQLPLTPDELQLASSSDLLVVGGTNLLSSHMQQYRQWQISLDDARSLHRVVLMGVGWWQYQDSPDEYTAAVLGSVLSPVLPQSVRDDYTREKLSSIGLKNTINTSCPTLWRLTPQRLARIPTTKADEALVMLTDYSKDRIADRALLELVLSQYKRVYFWPQGSGDARYISELSQPVNLLDRSLGALEQLLQRPEPIDYIGTRLHGGIKCLQHAKRSLVLGIDNRAAEIAADTGLAVVARKDLNRIRAWITDSGAVELKLDHRAIEKWKAELVSGLVLYEQPVSGLLRTARGDDPRSDAIRAA